MSNLHKGGVAKASSNGSSIKTSVIHDKDGYLISRHPNVEKILDRKIGEAYCDNLRQRVEAYLSAGAKLYKIYEKNASLAGDGTAQNSFVAECTPLYPSNSPNFYFPSRATGAGDPVNTNHPGGKNKPTLEFNSSEVCTAIYVALN